MKHKILSVVQFYSVSWWTKSILEYCNVELSLDTSPSLLFLMSLGKIIVNKEIIASSLILIVKNVSKNKTC